MAFDGLVHAGAQTVREARRFGAGRRFEVAVEAHRDVAQQQPPARRHHDLRLHPHQPVLGQRREAVQRGREVAGEIDRVAAFKRRHRDFALAHQRLDQVRAQLVVLVQAHAAEHRQAAVVERGLPARQVARVLAEAVADVADRADPSPTRSLSAWVV